MGFRSGQMTPRVWLLEGHRKKGKHRWTLRLLSFFYSLQRTIFPTHLFTAIPICHAPEPQSNSPRHTHQTITTYGVGCSGLHLKLLSTCSLLAPSLSQRSLLLCPEQPPQAGLGSSVPHTSSSRSNRKHRGGTACWVGPRRTTGQTAWLEDHGEELEAREEQAT